MKKAALVFCISFIAIATIAQHKLEKVWQTDSVMKVPESVLLDTENKVIYVANIDGTDPWAKDGSGSIGRVALDGKIVNIEWVKGLNSPKGMAIHKNNLYVADVTDLVVIDIKKGEISKRIAVPYAEGLNDVTIDPKGVVYVSDSRLKRVFMVKGNNATPHLESLKGPNGVKWIKDNLYLLDAGTLYRIEYDRKLTKLAEGMEGGTDGVEPVNDKDFIVSCWAGVIYYVNADGTKEILLDTRTDKINSADLSYDPVTRMVYVPTFWRNSVVAYMLK